MSSAHPSGCPPHTLTNQQSLTTSGGPELEGELMLLTVHRQVIIVRESLHGRQAAYHYLQTHALVVDVLVSASVGTISMVHRTPAGVTGSWKLTTPTTAPTSHAATQLRPPTGTLRTASSRAFAIPSGRVLHCQYPAPSPPATQQAFSAPTNTSSRGLHRLRQRHYS